MYIVGPRTWTGWWVVFCVAIRFGGPSDLSFVGFFVDGEAAM